MTDTLAIETNGLTKTFNGRNVVDGLSLQVPSGSVFGFLGPNGSGKTTTVRMMLGLAYATSGSVSLLGEKIPDKAQSVLQRVGALVEGPAFYTFLTGRQNLQRFNALSRTKSNMSIDKALEKVGLTHAANKKYRAYSLGMRQRLSLANALMQQRGLLILDEPTNGLDPQGTREVRQLINTLREEGITVFLSSHLLNEIDQVCTHAAVISAGKVVAQGPIEELRQSQVSTLRIETPDLDQAHQLLLAARLGSNVRVEQRAMGHGWIELELAQAQPEDIAAALINGGVRLRSMTNTQPSLEDAFVALTGEGFDVAE